MKDFKIVLYKRYHIIKKRCYNKNAQNYYLYGGRGIKVCDEWLNNPSSFYEWAKVTYFDGAFIDRIDVNGNYSPSNCRFITMLESANNKRNNVVVEYQNRKYTISELTRHTDCKVKYKTLYNRICNLHWEVELSMCKSYSHYTKSNDITKKSKVLNYKGEQYSLIGLCRLLDIEDKYHTVKARINKLNWNTEAAVKF